LTVGGEGNMAAAGLGVGPLSGRGGLLTTGVGSELERGVSSEMNLNHHLRVCSEIGRR
jgi:hypothetical protein